MIRQRVSTLLTTVSLLLSLTAVSVALPASTLAAIPEVGYGRGTEANDLGAASSAEPKKVSPGAYVQFKTWARNDDTSTISQFFLTETTGLTIYSAWWSKSDDTGGSCATTIPLSCSFGQLRPDESIDAVIVLQTPADAVGSIAVEFVWSSVGIGHGDSFPVEDRVGIKGGGDFSGRFLVGNDSLVVGDAETLSITNKQSTIVISPTTGIGVSVEDGPDTGACLPAGECFSETSEIQVGDGSEYGQFKVVVNLHSSQIPKGVNVNNLKVYHDGEQITTICADVPVADCFSAKKFKWGIQVTIWLEHNGKLSMG